MVVTYPTTKETFMDIPSQTVELVNSLKQRYPDKAEVSPQDVGTPEYWKKMGVIELIREIEYSIKLQGQKYGNK